MASTNRQHDSQLNRYHQKRHFKATPEPSGRVQKRRQKRLSFVIQEHHASHLHYDFRLEWDGVLKSWAVPKGPIMDSSQKRLAVEVEDHPIEYGKFEGVIPANEYGGGRVYIWDKGTWEPTGDVDEGFKKGRIDFKLKGKRLSGRWSLIRFRPNDRQPQWFLMYKGEGTVNDFSSPIEAPAELAGRETHAPKAAKSARKSRSAKGQSLPLPDFISPELPLLVEEAPKGKDWIHELKFDGYRIQTHIQAHGKKRKVQLITRSGQTWTHKYAEIARELEGLDVQSAVLDGEVVALDQTGKSDFQSLQLAMKEEATRSLLYYVFDILHLDGEDLRPLPLHERKARLKKLLAGLDSKLIRFSDDIHLEGAKFLKASCAQGLEGIVSKKVDSPYVSGRTKEWVKTKCGHRQEFVIGGYSEPQGGRTHLGALLLGVYEGDQLRFVGKCGTGFDTKTLYDTWKKLHAIERDESPFEQNSPRGKGIHWVKPKLVAEIAFSMWTRDKKLRVPVFQGLREDKPATEIVQEVPKVMQKDTPKAMAGKISHADKILFPKEKITKGDVAEFYANPIVQNSMLPYMERRPLALVRCPDGKNGGCFFQKHIAKLPAGLKGTASYVMLDSEAGVQALVQMGAFEIHAWQCREPEVEHPDQIVMDFDPDPTVSFAEVKKAAQELKDLLDELRLKSFLKVTGGKGLHVHIPIAPVYSWDRVKEFSRVLARELMSRQPSKYTDTLSKAKRKGRIFIDYLRNGRGATAVVPYVIRAKETSAVALPIEWSELSRLKSADQYDLKSALRYLKRRKKDPWKGINDLQQRIDILEEPTHEKAAKKRKR